MEGSIVAVLCLRIMKHMYLVCMGLVIVKAALNFLTLNYFYY